jgi:hypothetical protein
MPSVDPRADILNVASMGTTTYLWLFQETEMKKTLLRMALLLPLFVSCAPGSTIEVTVPDTTFRLTMPGSNPLVNQPDAQGRVAQGAEGFWHGLIVPVTLVLSLVNPDVQIYDVHNSGAGYNFGFFLGQAFMFGLLILFLRIRRPA